MDRNTLLKSLEQYVKLWNKQTESFQVLESMRILVQGYLQDNPCDSEILVKLTLIQNTPPMSARASKYLDQALLYDSNIKILLALSFLEYDQECGISESTMARLQAITADTREENALVWYAKSLYYYKNYNYTEYESALNNSLRFYSGFVWPQADLGQYYKNIGAVKESSALLQDALANVKQVFSYGDFIDFTSLDHFINENLKGTSLGAINYSTIKDLAADCIS